MACRAFHTNKIFSLTWPFLCSLHWINRITWITWLTVVFNVKVKANLRGVRYAPYRVNPACAILLVFLYSDAVFYAAGQEVKVLELQTFILTQDVALNLFQLCSEPLNQLLGQLLREVLLCVLTQRNLGRRKQEVAKERGTNVGGVTWS